MEHRDVKDKIIKEGDLVLYLGYPTLQSPARAFYAYVDHLCNKTVSIRFLRGRTNRNVYGRQLRIVQEDDLLGPNLTLKEAVDLKKFLKDNKGLELFGPLVDRIDMTLRRIPNEGSTVLKNKADGNRS